MLTRARAGVYFLAWLLAILCVTSCELLQNGGFENKMAGWHCWGFHCQVLGSGASHQGSHAVRTVNRWVFGSSAQGTGAPMPS